MNIIEVLSYFKKIFEPACRSTFIMTIAVLFILSSFVTVYGLFFTSNYNSFAIMNLGLVFFIVMLIMFYKRLLDITTSTKKSILFTVLLMIVWLCAHIIGFLVSSQEFNDYKVNKFITIMLAFIPIIILLFLSIKKGRVCNYEFKIKSLIKQIVILAVMFCAYFGILYSLNTLNVYIDYRMHPAIEIIDRVMAVRIYNHSLLKRGDIVCIPAQYGMKPLRLIGLPGERIELKAKDVYINGEKFDDKFAYYSDKLEPVKFNESFELDENSYLLIGDNRYYSKGGDIFVKANKKDLIGKIIAINYLSDDFPRQKTGIQYKVEHNPAYSFSKHF